MTTSSSGEAMRLAKEHTEIHPLIADVIIPEMNGRELVNRLLPLFPKLKVLFLSGYTADVIELNGVVEDGLGFLQKPFSKEVLSMKIRAVLNAPSPPDSNR